LKNGFNDDAGTGFPASNLFHLVELVAREYDSRNADEQRREEQ